MENQNILKENFNQQLTEIEASEVPTDEIKYNDSLNSKIFNNDTKKLKPLVRYKLLEIAKKYLESVKDFPNLKFFDIVLTGSATNYNYNEQSDLDLHIVVDYDKLDKNSDLLMNYFKKIKDEWSNLYKITIYGIPVEIFIQNKKTNEIPSASVYSLLNDKWLVEPQHLDKLPYDLDSIKKIASVYLTKLEDLKNEFKVNKDIDSIKKILIQIDEIKEDIAKLRKEGLDSKDGEFSNQNLAYKLLRNLLFFDEINSFKEQLINKELSLNELKK